MAENEQVEMSFDDVASANVEAFESESPEQVLATDPEDVALAEAVQAESVEEPAPESEEPVSEPDPRDAEIATLRASNERTQNQIDQLIAGVARGTEPATSVSEPEPEPLGAPPDPMTHPAEYTEWMGENTDRKLAAQREDFNRARQLDYTNAVQDELWSEFTALHSEWSESGALVREAAQKAAVDLGGSYSREQLYEQTHQNMVAIRAAMFGEALPEKPQPNRTAGMDGGSRTAPTPKQTPEKGKATGLVDEMLAIHNEMGL